MRTICDQIANQKIKPMKIYPYVKESRKTKGLYPVYIVINIAVGRFTLDSTLLFVLRVMPFL